MLSRICLLGLSRTCHCPASGHGNAETLDTQRWLFNSRFGDGTETNPEELIASAHAGCFSMALSMILEKAGFVADSIETKAVLTLDVETTTITKIDLDLTAKIPNITDAQFQELAGVAKANCPVSKVLKAEITLAAKLAG